jgi:branched-chain amino acid transport system permease protein
MTNGTHVGTAGEIPQGRGYRDQLRARWRRLPQEQRWAIAAGVEIVLAVLLWLLDHSLGYGAAVTVAFLWMPRLAPFPWRIALQAAVVAAFAIAAAASSTPISIAIVLAIGCAFFWVPARPRRWVLPLVSLAVAVLYPFYLSHLFTIPVFGAFPDISTGVYMIVFVMMAVGLNIVVGYAGLLDLGYVAFYATGAYTAAWFASLQFAGQKCPKAGVSIADCPVALVPAHSFDLGAVGVPVGSGGIHVSLWLLFLLAGVITAFFGIVIGLPTLRLRGDYLAIVTLGFGEILPQIARNGDNLFGFNVTNGPNGITPIDAPGWGHTLSGWTGGFLPASYLSCCSQKLLGHQIAYQDVFLWTAVVLLVITVFCSIRLRDSRLGRAWVAIREDETAAAAMGIPLMRTKTWAYASGAFFGGIAGAYFASFKSSTFPGDFFFNISVFILCMIILGGMGNIWGVIVGGAFLAYLNQEGLANTGSWINSHIHIGSHHPHIDVPLYASGIYGLIILLVMLFRPEGLIPSRRRAAELHEGVHDQPLYDATHSGA